MRITFTADGVSAILKLDLNGWMLVPVVSNEILQYQNQLEKYFQLLVSMAKNPFK